MSTSNSAQAQAAGVHAPADPALRRLATLLRLADGAWAVATYKDRAERRHALHHIRAAVAPVPLIEATLSQRASDPLAVLRAVNTRSRSSAPIVSFTGVEQALPDLLGYLDLERDYLAQLPYRLLFWLKPRELHEFARHAPNWMSRVSGVFDLAGELAPLERLALPRNESTLHGFWS